ncbi:MAG: hypothetical protein II695_07800 [Oscillospiraceae bacterium]|nr:hypothetical protein [Oscillospiraceae bacterium]
MNEKQQIFRKSGIERMNSPEQLTDYLRVTNPSVWVILAAVVILLVGFLVWSLNGKLEIVVNVAAKVESGTVAAVIVDEDVDAPVKKGQTMRINGTFTVVDEIYRDANGRKVAGASTDLPDGNYPAQIVTDTMTPISFLLE